MSEVTLQTAIKARNYTAEAVFYEDTKKNWRGENRGRGVCKQICITPYDGEGTVFTPSHPDFVEMFDVATDCFHGLRWSEEAITEENLAEFSRCVLACESLDSMSEIRQAIKLVDNRRFKQELAQQ